MKYKPCFYGVMIIFALFIGNAKISALSAYEVGQYVNKVASKGKVNPPEQPQKKEKQEITQTLLFDVLEFYPGSADLTERSMLRLNLLVEEGKQFGTINKIMIAAWGDRDKFNKEEKIMPKINQKIAYYRKERIRTHLIQELGILFSKIQSFNMAQKASWGSRLFKTESAKLKSLYQRRDEITPARDDFRVIVENGGPHNAVVVLEALNIPEEDSEYHYRFEGHFVPY